MYSHIISLADSMLAQWVGAWVGPYLGCGSDVLLILVGGRWSLIDEPSAASRLAVDTFLSGDTPARGLIGLSGET